MNMNRPEPTRQSDDQFEERLLDYDAALAAGHAREVPADDLPRRLRDGISCLELLERLRPQNRPPAAASPAGSPTRTEQSVADPPTDGPATPTKDDGAVPARLGRFEILRMLGQGGCGVVFLARDPLLNRLIALKVPRLERLLRPEMRQRFLREGRAAGCLAHPNLLPVFEAGEIGAICYLAAPYCPGITLSEWRRQQVGPVAPRTAAKLVATLADAMHYAHQKGICHRDLKPSNILLVSDQRSAVSDQRSAISVQRSAISGQRSAVNDPQSPSSAERSALSAPRESELLSADGGSLTTTPKIIDFGLAKVFAENSGDAITETGAVLGTPQYMAPEQAEGKTQAVGPATDVHALGVILYELLTGNVPFKGETDLETLRQVIAVEPQRPGRLRRGVPRDLDTICLKCLAKEPRHRYLSMAELAADLQRFLDHHPIQARPIGWGTRAVKALRRRPRTAAGTGAVLFILAVAGIAVGSREFSHNAAIGVLKARADEQDWLLRNQEYVSRIRLGAVHKKSGQWAALREVLVSQEPAPGQRDLRDFAWHYFWRSGQGFMLPGHDGIVTAVAYARNGEMIASGGIDRTVRLYNRHSGKPLATLRGHGATVCTAEFLAEDTQLLSTAFARDGNGASFRAEYILWSVGADSKVLRHDNYSYKDWRFGHPVFALAAQARILFIIDRRRTPQRLLRLDLTTSTEKELLTSDNLSLVATTAGADRLAVVHGHWTADWKQQRSSLKLIDPATMQEIAECRFDRPVHHAEFSPDGRTLALCVGMVEGSRMLEFREVPSLRLRKAHSIPLLPNSFHFDSQGKRVAVAAGQTHFYFFDVASGDSLGTLKHEAAHDRALAFAPTGEELAYGSADGRVRIGKSLVDHQDDALPGPAPASEAWCVAFAPDGNTLAASYDHENAAEPQTVLLWDRTTKKARTLAGHKATVMALAISPDGKTLASASHDHTVRLWDMARGVCRHTLHGHTGPVRGVAFSPDGLRVASTGSDLSIQIHSVEDGTLQLGWRAHAEQIRSLAFSPDGMWLSSTSNDRTIKLWNPNDRTLARTIPDAAQVQCVAWSPDGSLLASGNEENVVEIWNVADGTPTRTLAGHLGKVRSVTFSPDGKTLASGGEDKAVRLWNVVTGEEMLVFPTEHYVNGLAFDARSRVLAAALHDGTVRIWRTD
jgi:WD40 repeat protein/serine/threonine protein kinase